MKENNDLFKVTNKSTGEIRYYRKRQGVMWLTGLQASHQRLIERGLIKGKKGANWDIEIVDGSEVMWKDIDNFN